MDGCVKFCRFCFRQLGILHRPILFSNQRQKRSGWSPRLPAFPRLIWDKFTRCQSGWTGQQWSAIKTLILSGRSHQVSPGLSHAQLLSCSPSRSPSLLSGRGLGRSLQQVRPGGPFLKETERILNFIFYWRGQILISLSEPSSSSR